MSPDESPWIPSSSWCESTAAEPNSSARDVQAWDQRGKWLLLLGAPSESGWFRLGSKHCWSSTLDGRCSGCWDLLKLMSWKQSGWGGNGAEPEPLLPPCSEVLKHRSSEPAERNSTHQHKQVEETHHQSGERKAAHSVHIQGSRFTFPPRWWRKIRRKDPDLTFQQFQVSLQNQSAVMMSR